MVRGLSDTFFVVFSALVVESVGELVSHDDAHGAEIQGPAKKRVFRDNDSIAGCHGQEGLGIAS